MGKSTKKRLRNVRRFKAIDEKDRRNPASLRRLIYDLIYEEFSRSASRAADSLSEELRAHKSIRGFRRGYSGESLYKVVLDVQTVSYRQLDSIAVHYKLPLGLILLFSRVRSELEAAAEHRTSEALRVIRSSQASLAQLEQLVIQMPSDAKDVFAYLDRSAFERIRSAYLDEYHAIFT